MPTIRLIENNVHYPEQCFVCDGRTQDLGVLAVIEESQPSDQYTSYVCEECLAAGPDRIPDRLRLRAARIHEMADFLERMADEPWTAPTIDEWAEAAIADEQSEPALGTKFLADREKAIRSDVEYWKQKVI